MGYLSYPLSPGSGQRHVVAVILYAGPHKTLSANPRWPPSNEYGPYRQSFRSICTDNLNDLDCVYGTVSNKNIPSCLHCFSKSVNHVGPG